MNTYTPNTTTAAGNSGTPATSSEGLIICPDPFIEAETEAIGALEYGLYGMITGRVGIVREAMDMLSAAIKQEKWEEEREKRKEEKERERERERMRKGGREMEREMQMQREEERGREKEKEKENSGNATTLNTRWFMAGALIPPPPAASLTSPDPSSIAKNSAAYRVRGTARARAPPEVRQGQRRSMRIIESSQKFTQGKEEPAAPTLVKRAKTPEVRLIDQIVASAKDKSPILKPRSGAGVSKKTDMGGLRVRIAAKSKATAGMENEAENHTTANTTTTDKTRKAPLTQIPSAVPKTPQRPDMLTIKLRPKPEQKGAGPSGAGLAKKGKAPEKGLRGKNEEVSTKVKSPVLKPKAVAGVTKRGGKDCVRGRRSGKERGGEKAEF